MNIQRNISRSFGFFCALFVSVSATGCDQLWEEWIEQSDNLPGAEVLAPDSDADLLPDAFDCAPEDPEVHKSARKACTLPSGKKGETVCSYGAWGSCTEIPNQGCQADETREVGCERCGVQTERCEEGKWVAQGECREQKACEPGETYEHGVRATMTCGSGMVITFSCNDRCEWGSKPTKSVVYAGCQADQCCNGMSCFSAPFRQGCTPIQDMISHLDGETVIYPKNRR